MNYRAQLGLGISSLLAFALLATPVFAQDDEEAEAPPAKGSAPAKAEPDKAADSAKPEGDAKAAATAEVDTSAAPKAAEAHDSVTVTADATPAGESQAASRAPVYGKRGDWNITPYGYARFDAIEDSTQSFEDGIQPNLIARVGTYRGDHRRTIFTARDSRLGIFVGAPTFEGIKTSALI